MGGVGGVGVNGRIGGECKEIGGRERGVFGLGL